MVKDVDVVATSYEFHLLKTHGGGRNGDQKDGGGSM
jgi:hypothetical protein